VYNGYRKAKFLAAAIGGKKGMLYYVHTQTMTPLWPAHIAQKIASIILLAWNSIVFWWILFFFVAFIVIPLKVRKFLQK
jgi:hypothetical protein